MKKLFAPSLKHFSRHRMALGIEYHAGNDEAEISSTRLTQRKQSVEHMLTQRRFRYAEFFEYVKIGEPLYLSITGRGVIHRRLNGNSGDPQLLEQVLPNANPEDFYVQYTTSSPGKVFVSVARKKMVDEVIALFHGRGHPVLACCLGPFATEHIFPYMQLNPSLVERVELGGSRLEVVSGKIESYALSEERAGSYMMSGEEREGDSLVSFASAMLAYNGLLPENNIDRVKEYREEFRQEKIFYRGGLAILFCMAVLLCANGFIYRHYNIQNVGLASELQRQQGLVLYYDTLRKQLSEKRAFLESAGLLETSRTSFYADQLAMDLPPQIRLQKMNINPAVKKMNDNKEELEFSVKLISVTGLCRKSNELNDWIRLVKRKKWVRTVTLVQYNQEKANEAGIFTIDIQLVRA